MSELGDLLELLYNARESFSTAQLTVRSWTHMARSNKAFERWHSTQAPGSVTRFGAGTRVAEVETITRIWRVKPDLWRSESQGSGDDHIRVYNGGRWWSYSSNGRLFTNVRSDGTVTSAESAMGDPMIRENFFDPARLIPTLTFEDMESVEQAGRRAIKLSALPRSNIETVLWFGADRYELIVDAELGTLLSASGYIDGEMLAIVEITEAVFDAPIPDSTFTFDTPPDAQAQIAGETPLPTRSVSLPPPERPPDVFLVDREGENTRVAGGVLTRYDWRIGDRVEQHGVPPPAPWPTPLAISDASELAVRLECDLWPALVEVRFYAQLDKDGVPAGEPHVFNGRNARIFSGSGGRVEYVRVKEQGMIGWETHLPFPEFEGVRYLTMWAAWHSNYRDGPHSANWLFAIEKRGAS